LLGGMWEFPNGRVVDVEPAKALAKVLRAGYRLKAQKREAVSVIQHTYTHFKLTTHVFRCELLSESKDENLKWISLKKLEEYPMGKVDRQIARMLYKNETNP